MARHRIKMAITGRGATPEMVPIEVLAKILSHIKDVVLAAVGSAEELPEDATIGLVAIEESSDGLVLSAPGNLIPAVSRVSKAVSTGHYSDLPENATSELRRLAATVGEHGWALEVEANRELDIHHAKIHSGAMPPPEVGAPIRGATAIYGRCLRVGGAVPKAEIRLPSGRMLYAELSEDVARELGKVLYEEVVLEGVATWEAATWEVQEFRIDRVSAYCQTDPVLAFKELAEASHGKWDGVDAAEYVRALRSDDR